MYNFCAKFRKILDICKYHSEVEVRKRIETDFSQICDKFLIVRNYAKNVIELFTRINGKISSFIVLQYINKTNNQVKYVLL